MNFVFRKTLKFFYSLLPPNIKSSFVYIFGLQHPSKLYMSLNKYNSSIKEINSLQKELYDWNVWKKALKRSIWSDPDNIEIAMSFLFSEFKLLKKTQISYSEKDVTLICVVKNDLQRMKMFYDHYRKIGIKHFVIIDNNSDDGTREWLLRQPDSEIYLAKDKFNSRRKYGWINKILSIYGFNRWYLYVDSDELFVFQDIEHRSIQDLVKYAGNRKINRIAALMLDMYSNQGLFNQKSYNIVDEYVYFDKDSYLVSTNYKGMKIMGGPRKRMLQYDKNWSGPLLIKHPLFYWEEGNIFESAHYIFPFEKESFLAAALLHYKFLETDLKRYKQIAKEGNFSGGSKEYKQYIKSFENNKDLTFMYEGSTKYVNSSSLQSIPFLKKINWAEYDKINSASYEGELNEK